MVDMRESGEGERESWRVERRGELSGEGERGQRE